MLQLIEGDDHPLRDLFVVFPVSPAVEGTRFGGRFPPPLQPMKQVFLCDQRQLQEAVDAATGGDPPRMAMVFPLTDMPHIAQLLQHGMSAWIGSRHRLGKKEERA